MTVKRLSRTGKWHSRFHAQGAQACTFAVHLHNKISILHLLFNDACDTSTVVSASHIYKTNKIPLFGINPRPTGPHVDIQPLDHVENHAFPTLKVLFLLSPAICFCHQGQINRLCPGLVLAVTGEKRKVSNQVSTFEDNACLILG